MILAALIALAGSPAFGAEDPIDKLWQSRVIVLLGEREIPDVKAQTKILQRGAAELKERQVEILNEQRPSGLLHKRYGHGEGFLVILIGKDGEEKLRSLKPVALEKITKLIDSMPMRKDEQSQAAPKAGT
ncbi:MAG: DUF4174 domain-containing protein [Proteobacteria bacterium]|nr:MAG: DUF4174 domain-containing protein [Pseudomonadota bacterium]